MANNRLWIVDDETGDRLLLAKSLGDGWSIWPDLEALEDLDTWLRTHDSSSSFGNVNEMKPTRLRLVDEIGEGLIERVSVARGTRYVCAACGATAPILDGVAEVTHRPGCGRLTPGS